MFDDPANSNGDIPLVISPLALSWPPTPFGSSANDDAFLVDFSEIVLHGRPLWDKLFLFLFGEDTFLGKVVVADF